MRLFGENNFVSENIALITDPDCNGPAQAKRTHSAGEHDLTSTEAAKSVIP
jgi:hypothetical protein